MSNIGLISTRFARSHHCRITETTGEIYHYESARQWNQLTLKQQLVANNFRYQRVLTRHAISQAWLHLEEVELVSHTTSDLPREQMVIYLSGSNIQT